MYVNFDDVLNTTEIVNKEIPGVPGRNNWEAMTVSYLLPSITMFIIGDIQ